MKKIALLLSLAFLTFSCSDDDSEGSSSVSTSDLEGTWILTSETENGVAQELDECELEEALIFTEDTLVMVDSFISSSVEDLNEDGTVTVTEIECGTDEGDSMEYFIDNNELIYVGVYDDVEENIFFGVPSIDGDVLTITDEDDSFSFIQVYTRQ